MLSSKTAGGRSNNMTFGEELFPKLEIQAHNLNANSAQNMHQPF